MVCHLVQASIKRWAQHMSTLPSILTAPSPACIPIHHGLLLMTLEALGAPQLGLGPSRHGLMLAAAGL